MVLMTQKESIMIFGKYLSTFPDVNPRFLPEKAQSKILWILETDYMFFKAQNIDRSEIDQVIFIKSILGQ